MASLNQLEDNLESIFVKKAPKLPEGAKKTIVEYLPWINLVLGLLTLWSAYALWHWAHIANSLVDYANTLNKLYGTGTVVSSRLTVGIWLGLIVLVIEALLYIAAFPGTRDKKKAGWNLLFYALLVNVVYGVVVMFTSYGGFGSLISYVVGSAIGLYILFQIRSSYN